MSIPDFQTLMLPLLQLAADQREHTMAEAIDWLGDFFGLTEDERREVLPSGRQSRLDNRVGWAATYLRKSGLFESRGRGKFTISLRGLEVLQQPPSRITIKYLEQFSEFVKFRGMVSDSGDSGNVLAAETEQTPDEILREAFKSINDQLAEDLLSRILDAPPKFFEQLVVELLLAMGYGGTYAEAGRAIGTSGDEGVDGVINEDRLGLDVLYIQAKRYAPENSVGRPAVQGFVGALEAKRAQKGIFITTSRFSDEARAYTGQIQKRIVLIDGNQLAQFMIQHNVGVTQTEVFTLRRVDEDYFSYS